MRTSRRGSCVPRALSSTALRKAKSKGIKVITYDADSGQLISGSFMDYQMPRADDIPSVHLETRAVPTAVNPLGVKGVGEAGTVGSLVATINAICDALSPLGIRHIEMPATPARVWAAIQDAKRANPAPQN